MSSSTRSQGTVVQVDGEVLSRAAFGRRFGWRMTDEERAALEAGDRVVLETGETVEIVVEKWTVTDALVRAGASREEAGAWVFAFGVEAA